MVPLGNLTVCSMYENGLDPIMLGWLKVELVVMMSVVASVVVTSCLAMKLDPVVVMTLPLLLKIVPAWL